MKSQPDKQAPHSQDAEFATIGSILIDSEVLSEIDLQPDDFHDDRARWTYEAMLKLGEASNQITVAQELARAGHLEGVGGVAFLSQVVSVVPTSIHAAYYADIVRQCAYRRKLIQAAGQIAATAYEGNGDSTALHTRAAEAIAKLSPHEHDDIVNPEDHAKRMLEMVSNRRQGQVKSLKFGYVDLDRFVGGMTGGNLVIVGARPGVGKCIGAGTLICDSQTGELIPVENWTHERSCLALSSAYKLRSSRPIGISRNGIQECFEITTGTGRRIILTIHHPLLTGKGWQPLSQLAIGDMIAVPRNLPIFGNQTWGKAKVKLLAYLLAEGNIIKAGDIRFTNADSVLVGDFQNSLKDVFPDCETVYADRYEYRIVKKTRRTHIANPVGQWLKSLNCLHRSKEKVIPNEVFSLREEEVRTFLGIFFSCDGGWAKKDHSGIEICLASENLISQIQHLLLRFGIISQKHFKPSLCNGRRFNAWRLAITGGNVTKFATVIGFYGNKAKTFQPRLKSTNPNLDLIPLEVWDILKSECENNGVSLWDIDRRRIGKPYQRKGINPHFKKRHLTRQRLAQYAQLLDSNLLRQLSDSDVFWDRIVSIQTVGLRPTFDLSLQHDHNFVAGDFIVHNSQWMQEVALYNCHKAVLIASAEMSLAEYDERDIAMSTGISVERQRAGQLTGEEWDAIQQLVAEVSGRKLYFLEGKVSTDSISRKARLLYDTVGLDLIVVDYLQLLRDSVERKAGDSIRERVGYISNNLKSLARELDIPVLAASQLNRNVEGRENKRPTMADLKESGSIEQDADIVLLLHRPDLYDASKEKGILYVGIAKIRQIGKTGVVKLVWNEAQHRYCDLQEGKYV